MKHILILLPLMVAVSGCTIPGTGINIPLPWENTISLENDIIIIKSLDAIPPTVTAPQQIRVIATIQNNGNKEFSTKSGENKIDTSTNKIIVDLFDHCQGLFKSVVVNCPDTNQKTGTSCTIDNILPKESKEINWILIPKEDTKLITPCDLKVSVSYPYQTDGLTTVHFINSKEYDRQLAQGTFSSRISTTSLGQGPVKAWYEVKDKQPIPITGDKTSVQLSLNIENKGSGFVVGDEGPTAKIDETNIFNDPFSVNPDKCAFKKGENIKLIQDKRILPCPISYTSGNVPKETTHQLTASISYLYEFRKQVKVTVEPPFKG